MNVNDFLEVKKHNNLHINVHIPKTLIWFHYITIILGVRLIAWLILTWHFLVFLLHLQKNQQQQHKKTFYIMFVNLLRGFLCFGILMISISSSTYTRMFCSDAATTIVSLLVQWSFDNVFLLYFTNPLQLWKYYTFCNWFPHNHNTFYIMIWGYSVVFGCENT